MASLVDVWQAMAKLFPGKSVRVIEGLSDDMRRAELDDGARFRRRTNESGAAFQRRVEAAADKVGALCIRFSK